MCCFLLCAKCETKAIQVDRVIHLSSHFSSEFRCVASDRCAAPATTIKCFFFRFHSRIKSLVYFAHSLNLFVFERWRSYLVLFVIVFFRICHFFVSCGFANAEYKNIYGCSEVTVAANLSFKNQYLDYFKIKIKRYNVNARMISLCKQSRTRAGLHQATQSPLLIARSTIHYLHAPNKQ